MQGHEVDSPKEGLTDEESQISTWVRMVNDPSQWSSSARHWKSHLQTLPVTYETGNNQCLCEEGPWTWNEWNIYSSLYALLNYWQSFLCLYIKSVLFIYLLTLFLERGGGREKERERNTDWLPLACPLAGTWPTAQGMGPEWKLNRQTFSSQADTHTTEPH